MEDIPQLEKVSELNQPIDPVQTVLKENEKSSVRGWPFFILGIFIIVLVYFLFIVLKINPNPRALYFGLIIPTFFVFIFIKKYKKPLKYLFLGMLLSPIIVFFLLSGTCMFLATIKLG